MTQDRPVIGISVFPRHPLDDPLELVDGVDRRYVTAIVGAGAIPLLIPVVRPEDVPTALDRVDGLILSGGGDIDPGSYDQPPTTALRDPRPDRDACELALVREAHARKLPVLGICRGMQCLTVATGGALVQEIGPHHPSDDDLSVACHEVRVEPTSRLAELLPTTELRVNSQHHQAIQGTSRDFRIAALGPDGVIEAIEATTDWWAVGVQWHPEALLAAAESKALFTDLVEQAGRRAGLRS